MQEFTHWIADTTGAATYRAIAATLGTTHPTIKNRIDRKDPLLAIEIAQHYNGDPVAGLVAAGAVTKSQIFDYAKEHGFGIDEYTDLDLALVIVERLEKAEREQRESTLNKVIEFDSYAADDSDTEPEPGDDDFHDGP